MSVQSEIDRIITAVGNAYSKVSEKGGTVPASQTVANLATAIGSIPAGGSAPSLQSKSVTYTSNGTATIMPDEDYDGLSSVDVTVNVASGGGGGDFNFDGYIGITKATSGTYTVAGNLKRVTIQHGLGEIPKIILALPEYDSSVTTNNRGFGCFLAVLPSNDKFMKCTFRISGTNNASGGTVTDLLDLSDIGHSLGTSYSTKANAHSFMFGTDSNTNKYYTILSGTTFHWITMA